MILYTIKGSEVAHLYHEGTTMLCGLGRFKHSYTLFCFAKGHIPHYRLLAGGKRLCEKCKKALVSPSNERLWNK